MNFDSDYSASAVAGDYELVTIPTASIPNFDKEAVRAFVLATGSVSLPAGIAVPAFTKIVGNTIQFVVSGSVVPVQGSDVTLTYSLQPTDANRGDFEDGNTNLNGGNGALLFHPRN